MLPLKPKAVSRTARSRELKEDISILMGVKGRQLQPSPQNTAARVPRNRSGLNGKENKNVPKNSYSWLSKQRQNSRSKTHHTTIHDLPQLVTASQTRSVVSELAHMDRKSISSSGHGENSGWKILKSRPAFRNDK